MNKTRLLKDIELDKQRQAPAKSYNRTKYFKNKSIRTSKYKGVQRECIFYLCPCKHSNMECGPIINLYTIYADPYKLTYRPITFI